MDDFNSVIYSKTIVLAEFAWVLACLENNSHMP